MPNTFQLSVFRSPRHHVLSQYMMCAYVLGGKKGHLIPFASPKERYQIGFGKWLDHFKPGQPYDGPKDTFDCYNPVDSRDQARPHFACWMV